MTKDKYKNIPMLLEQSKGQKIVVRRDSWAKSGFAVVHEIVYRHSLDTYGRYAWMHITYANGNQEQKAMPSGTHSWELIGILPEDAKITYEKATR